MIQSFACAETELVFKREVSKELPPDIQQTAKRKLDYLNAASSLLDLRSPPGNKLEALKGNRVGQHSIRINNQWRLCFRWREGNAYEVEIVDYH
jgi:toxin HigB-1